MKTPPVLSFVPGTSVLWRDDRSECGTVVTDGDPVVIVETANGIESLLAGRLIADPAAELARRALVEQLPESWSAEEVSLMSDDEAIASAVGAGVLEG